MLESLSEHTGFFYYLFQCLASMLGLLVVSIGLPGQFLPGIVALIGWMLGWNDDVGTLDSIGVEAAVLIGAGFLAELVEFLSGLIGGKAAGASRQGSIGAMLGGFVGGIGGNLLLPIVGGLVGILVGTFVGAYLGEKKALEQRQEHSGAESKEKAVTVGFASLVGRALGLAAKIVLVLMILFYFSWNLLFLW